MINSDVVISTEKLKNLGIYELRELARNLGVVSPTTKKREELCEQIIKISSGEQKIDDNKSKKGRPPKSVTKISSFVNDFIPDEVLSLQQQKTDNLFNNGIISLAQNPLLKNSFGDQGKQIYGYVNVIKGHFYIKNLKPSDKFKDLLMYIPNELVEKHELREGDRIDGSGRLSETRYCGIIDEITAINGEESSKYGLTERKTFDISGFAIPDEKSNFMGKEVFKGDRTISILADERKAIVDLIKDLENCEDKVVFVGIEIAPEILFYVKSSKNIESFSTSFYNTLEESYQAVKNSINYTETLLRSGRSVTFILFGIEQILTRLDMYFANDNSTYLGHSVEAEQLLKKLIGMGKSLGNGLSLTTHSIMFGETNDEFIKNEISKIFTRKI